MKLRRLKIVEDGINTIKNKEGSSKQANPPYSNKLAGKIDGSGLQRESNEIEYINIYWDEWRD